MNFIYCGLTQQEEKNKSGEMVIRESGVDQPKVRMRSFTIGAIVLSECE